MFGRVEAGERAGDAPERRVEAGEGAGELESESPVLFINVAGRDLQIERRYGGLLSDSDERKYYEKLLWKSFSHICTVPVESFDDLDIVTGAHFEVGDSSLKKVLFLRLHFSKVSGVVRTNTDWEGSPNSGLTQRSGLMLSIISTRFTTTELQPPRPSDVTMNSAIYPGGPPVPTQSPKLLKFVDTAEVSRGPQHLPGYWVVSGARLLVENGKISLKVKYSLLMQILPDDEQTEWH